MTTSANSTTNAAAVATSANTANSSGNSASSPQHQLQPAQQQQQQHSSPLSTSPLQPQQQQQQQQTQRTPPSTRATQYDEDFNIRFVNLVRGHKCLYDKKVPEYRNRDNQEKAWSLISQETRESVIHCKERWRNLRACLSRYIKQQSGTDPQHKPYYLTEHMAFLLPFLKSTRSSMEYQNGNNSLAALFQISQQQLQQQQEQHHQQQQIPLPMHMIPHHMKYEDSNRMEMKHSLSDNDDEETIDAFDPAVTATLQFQQQLQHNHHHNHSQHNNNNNGASINNGRCSPQSDTASANTELQNFIPDVQLAEVRTPVDYAAATNHCGRVRRTSSDFAHHEPKRIKTELEASSHVPLYGGATEDCADMEFFRSILPDLATLTPQQKRKFKIGILELIDDVVERYPADRAGSSTSTVAATSSSACRQQRSSSRDWRK